MSKFDRLISQKMSKIDR